MIDGKLKSLIGWGRDGVSAGRSSAPKKIGPPRSPSIWPGLKNSASTPKRSVMPAPTRMAPANASPLPVLKVEPPDCVEDVRTTSAPIAPPTYSPCARAAPAHNTLTTVIATPMIRMSLLFDRPQART